MTLYKCDDDCMPLCDFCIYYKDSNPESPKICNGEGLCELTGNHTYLDAACDDFHCFNVPVNQEEAND